MARNSALTCSFYCGRSSTRNFRQSDGEWLRAYNIRDKCAQNAGKTIRYKVSHKKANCRTQPSATKLMVTGTGLVFSALLNRDDVEVCKTVLLPVSLHSNHVICIFNDKDMLHCT